MKTHFLPPLLGAAAIALAGPAAAQSEGFLAGAAHVDDLSKSFIADQYAAASPACQASFTVASAPNGSWAYDCGAELSPAALQERALERCSHLSGHACGIEMSGGAMTDWRAAEVAVTYPDTFQAEAVPFVGDEARAILASEYQGWLSPTWSALAISRNGAWAASRGAASAAQAEAQALSACNAGAGGTGCFLYARGDEVLFGPQTGVTPELAVNRP